MAYVGHNDSCGGVASKTSKLVHRERGAFASDHAVLGWRDLRQQIRSPLRCMRAVFNAGAWLRLPLEAGSH